MFHSGCCSPLKYTEYCFAGGPAVPALSLLARSKACPKCSDFRCITQSPWSSPCHALCWSILVVVMLEMKNYTLAKHLAMPPSLHWRNQALSWEGCMNFLVQHQKKTPDEPCWYGDEAAHDPHHLEPSMVRLAQLSTFFIYFIYFCLE